MTDDELIKAVRELRTDFEAAINLRYMIVRTRSNDKEFYKAVRNANKIGSLYERTTRLAKERGISQSKLYPEMSGPRFA